MTRPPLTLSAWLRYDLIERTLTRLSGIESVLEIGAGEGALGARLAARYDYTGVEPDPTACARARERVGPAGGRVVCGGLEELGPASFDLVCAFEVLEHIPDDAAALRAWWERLQPGGRLMVTVPPFQRRFGAADRRVGHLRRYEPEGLVEALRSAGFVEVEAALFGFPFGRGLEVARNVLARAAPSEGSAAERSATSGRWVQPPDRLGPLTHAVALPARLCQRPFIGSRWGSGLFAVARRPAQADGRSAAS
jgi:SAM-dependent methyltransferase